MYACIYVCLFVCLYVCKYSCIYVSIYSCMYFHILVLCTRMKNACHTYKGILLYVWKSHATQIQTKRCRLECQLNEVSLIQICVRVCVCLSLTVFFSQRHRPSAATYGTNCRALSTSLSLSLSVSLSLYMYRPRPTTAAYGANCRALFPLLYGRGRSRCTNRCSWDCECPPPLPPPTWCSPPSSFLRGFRFAFPSLKKCALLASFLPFLIPPPHPPPVPLESFTFPSLLRGLCMHSIPSWVLHQGGKGASYSRCVSRGELFPLEGGSSWFFV